MKRKLLLVALIGLTSAYTQAQNIPPLQENQRLIYQRFYPPLPPPISPIPPKPENGISIIPSVSTVNPSPISPTPSPEITSANRLQDINVNLYTGSASVVMPIYTLTAAGLQVPIYLRHDATGFRVGAMAGWTGQNWDLVAMPTLSRIVKGLPDEGKLDYTNSWNTNVSRKGYFYYGREVTPISTDKDNDKEPDEFFLTINGTPYKFMFDAYQNAHFFPEADIKVEVFATPNPEEDNTNHYVKVFTLFRFTMPDGTQYEFDNTNTEATAEVEVHYANDNQIYPSTAHFNHFLKNDLITTAWYVKRINKIKSEGVISFEYDKVQYSYFKLAEYEGVFPCPANGSINHKINKVYVKGSSIYRIKTNDKEVIFNYGNRNCVTSIDPYSGSPVTFCYVIGDPRYDIDSWTATPQSQSNAKQLMNIHIQDAQTLAGGIDYKFEYGYFNGANNSGFDLPNGYSYSEVGYSHQKRLKLSKIIFPDSTFYKFKYFGEDVGFNFKTRFTMGLDHWGYMNGADGNILLTGLIGRSDIYQTCTTGSNRETDFSYLKYGALTQIKNSMGNEINLDYEAHRAKNYVSGNQDIGGLRIKQINYKDSLSGIETVKKYSYLKSNNQSSGFMCMKPIYRYDNGGATLFRSELYQGLLAEIGRPAVGYNVVTETTFDNSNNANNNLGSVTTYFDQDTTELTIQKYFPQYNYTGYLPVYFHAKHDFKGGNPIKVEVFNKAGQLLSSQQSVFTPNNGVATDSTYARKVYKLWNGSQYVTQYDDFYQAFSKYRLDQSIAKTYSQDGTGTPQITTTNYTHKDQMPATYKTLYKGKHNELVKVSSTDIFGYSLESITKFVGDMDFTQDSTYLNPDCFDEFGNQYPCGFWVFTDHVPPSGTDARALYELKKFGATANQIESINKRNTYVIAGAYTTYHSDTSLYFKLPKASFSLENLPLTTFSDFAYNKMTESITTDTSYGLARMNYLTYNVFNLLKSSQVKHGAKSLIDYGDNIDLAATSIQNYGSPSALTTQYQYTNRIFGVSQITNPNVVALKYQYKSDGRLKAIFDTNNMILKQYKYNLLK